VPLLSKARRVVLLSGTPALSRPLELYPQIQAVQPQLFPKFFDYGRRYCAGQQGHFGWDFRGASNLRELQLLLERTLMLRRTKETVLSQLPRKIRQQVFLQVPAKETERLHRLEDLSFENEDGGGGGDGDLDQLMQRKAEYMALWRRTSEIKLPAMLDYLDELLENRPGQKVLVFAHHQSILDGFEGRLLQASSRGRFIRIDGRTPPSQRQELVQAFQEDPAIRVALLSITAASTGITLTAATLVVFAELYWLPGVLLQAEDRAHRLGQTDSVNVHYLLAKGTTDDTIWPLIVKKMAMLESVGLGKKSEFASIDHNQHDPHQRPLDFKKGF